MSAVQHFILVFDRRADRLLEQIEFGTQRSAAVARYEELEAEFSDSPHIDIVLVGADSIETVKVTHANYFGDRTEDRYADVLSIAHA